MEIIKKLNEGKKCINLATDIVGCTAIYEIGKNREIKNKFIPSFSGNPAVSWTHICRITKIVLYSGFPCQFSFH
jgi:hypothetical protein